MADIIVDVARAGDRLNVTVKQDGKVLFADRCDPQSKLSRGKLLGNAKEALPQADLSELEAALLDAAAPQAPAADNATPCPVPPNPEPWGDPVDGAVLLDRNVST